MRIPNAMKLPASELARMFSTVPAAKSPRSSKPKRAPAVYRNGKRVELAERENPSNRAVRCERCQRLNGPLEKVSDQPARYRCRRCVGMEVRS